MPPTIFFPATSGLEADQVQCPHFTDKKTEVRERKQLAQGYTVSDGSEPSAQTHHVVHGLEVEIGGHLHVGAAEGQDAQAEVQQL